MVSYSRHWAVARPTAWPTPRPPVSSTSLLCGRCVLEWYRRFSSNLGNPQFTRGGTRLVPYGTGEMVDKRRGGRWYLGIQAGRGPVPHVHSRCRHHHRHCLAATPAPRTAGARFCGRVHISHLRRGADRAGSGRLPAAGSLLPLRLRLTRLVRLLYQQRAKGSKGEWSAFGIRAAVAHGCVNCHAAEGRVREAVRDCCSREDTHMGMHSRRPCVIVQVGRR